MPRKAALILLTRREPAVNSTDLILMIAILSIWFSLTCGLVVLYLLLSGGELGVRFRSGRRSKPLSVTPSSSTAPDDTPVLVDKTAGAWGLFVMFDEPTMASNERLSIVLASSGAVYESNSKSFTLAGDSPRNPIHIANAYPPATLPSARLPPAQRSVGGRRARRTPAQSHARTPPVCLRSLSR